jgi:hypothetical protein
MIKHNLQSFQNQIKARNTESRVDKNNFDEF